MRRSGQVVSLFSYPKFVAEIVGQLTAFSAHAKRTHYLIRAV